MYYNLIMTVPESLQIDAVDTNLDYLIGNDVVASIASLEAIWPAHIVPDTKVVAGKKLAHAEIYTGSYDPLGMINALITLYELDWQVLGMQPYAWTPVDSGQVDADGKIIYKQLAQKNMDLSVLPYLNDRLDASNNPLPKQLSWLHQYAGQQAWI